MSIVCVSRSQAGQRLRALKKDPVHWEALSRKLGCVNLNQQCKSLQSEKQGTLDFVLKLLNIWWLALGKSLSLSTWDFLSVKGKCWIGCWFLHSFFIPSSTTEEQNSGFIKLWFSGGWTNWSVEGMNYVVIDWKRSVLVIFNFHFGNTSLGDP